MKDSIQLRIVYESKRPEEKKSEKKEEKRMEKKGGKSDKSSILVGKVESPQFSSGDDATSTEVSQHIYTDKARRDKVLNSNSYSEHQDIQHRELLD